MTFFPGTRYMAQCTWPVESREKAKVQKSPKKYKKKYKKLQKITKVPNSSTNSKIIQNIRSKF
jgi:hypothetical protein